MMQDTM